MNTPIASIACSYCGAAAGVACTTANGNTARASHAARRKKAEAVDAGRTVVIERTAQDDEQPALFEITDGEIRALYELADLTNQDGFVRTGNTTQYLELYNSIRPTRLVRTLHLALDGRQVLRDGLTKLGISTKRQDRVLGRATARPVAARATHSDIMRSVVQFTAGEDSPTTGIEARRGQWILTRQGSGFRVNHVSTVIGNDGTPVRAVWGINPDGSEHGPYFAHEYTIQ